MKKNPLLENTMCPVCSSRLDGTTCVFNNSEPKEGDLTICGYCISLLRFNKDFSLRKITRDELRKIKNNDPELLLELVIVQDAAKMFLVEKQQREN